MTITRKPDIDKFRRMCRKNDFCDMMPNASFEWVCEWFTRPEIDNDTLRMIAWDIVRGTAKYREDTDHTANEMTENVLYYLLNDCFYYIPTL